MKKIYSIKKEHIMLLMFLSLLVFSQSLFAQQRQITGKVIGQADGQPIPGAALKIKGKVGGTGTNNEGSFAMMAATGDILQVSSIGYASKEIAVTGSNVYTLTLVEEDRRLEEVVVIGYGVQKKKLTTGATVQVKGEELQKQSTTNALQSLQGQTPGVQIAATSGQPGEGFKVTIRGLGTINNSSPLYVVDGVLTDDITYLNTADIESIDVLKDAASAAIYGSQAANGVVLVTTRTGKRGQSAQITFDAYTGLQSVGNKVELLDATAYASIFNEAAINSGMAPVFTNAQIAALGKGTDWIDQMLVDDALTQNYSLGASGASEASVYSLGLSYTGQEGVVGGANLSNYKRYSFRLNSEHSFYKDIVKIGQHFTYTDIKSNGIGVGNQYNNTLRSAFNTHPMMPVYDADGNFHNSKDDAFNTGQANPYGSMVYTNQNKRTNQRLLGDVYAVIEPIENLKFRTSLGLNYYSGDYRAFSPIYELSAYAYNRVSRATQSMNKNQSLIWDNLLSYSFKVKENHAFEVLAGMSAYKEDGSSLSGTNTHLFFDDFDHAWLDNATNKESEGISINGAADDPDRRLSYFGRLNYNYKEKYLLNVTFRADGSSNFSAENRWGYFPSVSAGWVVTSEDFMDGQEDWLDQLKIRASWGQVGNQNVAANQYLSPINIKNTNYIFGTEEGTLTAGAYPSRLSNSNLQWETSEQTDLGFDALLFKGKIGINFDYYKKTTKDWIILAPILATAGADAPYINGGSVVNEGLELALSYKNKAGDFNYSIGLNGAYNKNTVGAIPTEDGTIHGQNNVLYDNATEFYRAQNGFPIGYFWGLKTAGVFQNEAQIAAYKAANGTVIQPGAQPGDVIFQDLNGDGLINAGDKTNIGNPNPKYNFGITLSANYKGWDFSLVASGVAGNKIVQSYRNQSSQFSNYTRAILDRWHGEGTSNTVPRVTNDNRNYTTFSDLFIQDGDFLRISNLTLGYDFSRIIRKGYFKQVRLYAAALNLYTFTTYDGMDPEIGYGTETFSSGVDLGYYPRPRTFMLGLNLKF